MTGVEFALEPLANEPETSPMPTMSNLRRRKIQMRQRKALNEKNRLAKIAKKEANAARKKA